MRSLFQILCTALAVAFAMPAQQPARTDQPAVIKTESRLVLVDAVVRDKKGAVITDLTPKDFKVWEDGKEQSISNVTFEKQASPNDPRKQYFVLFFDNATVGMADQMGARKAATQFIDRNAGGNKLMAVVEFSGAARITQNFTASPDKLKAAVSRAKTSSVAATAESGQGGPNLTAIEADFGARSVLTALVSVAKNLMGVPGRKTLIFFSAGFQLTPELTSEVTAAINACNRANVAVYPIDARGLVAPSPGSPGGMAMNLQGGGLFLMASLLPQSSMGIAMQRPSAPPPNPGTSAPRPSAPTPMPNPGAGNTSPRPSAPSMGAPTRGSAPMPNTNPNMNTGRYGGGNTNMNMPRQPMPPVRNPYFDGANKIIPQLGSGISGSQMVLHMLADGTGGMVILNTNDLLAGLEKIGNDQNEYYILSYTPPESDEGSCHSLKVKVNRGGSVVRARTGYCNAKNVDILAGSSVDKTLEGRLAAASAQPTPGAAIQTPFFYATPDTARVNVSMNIPFDTVKFEHKKGKYKAAVHILGIAYKNDLVAARFSDTVNIEFENKKDMESNSGKNIRYESQFEIAPGQYTVRVAWECGKDSFGRLDTPLAVDSWDGKKLGMSSLAISRDIRPVDQTGAMLAMQMLADRKPMISEGMQLIPSATNRLKVSGMSAVYCELYEPGLTSEKPPILAIQLRILDSKTGQQKQDSGLTRVDNMIKAGSPVVPLGLRVPTDGLTAGMYKLELKAIDSLGNTSIRQTDFVLE